MNTKVVIRVANIPDVLKTHVPVSGSALSWNNMFAIINAFVIVQYYSV